MITFLNWDMHFIDMYLLNDYIVYTDQYSYYVIIIIIVVIS